MSESLAAAVAAGGPGAALAICRGCVSFLPMTGAAITIMADADGAQEPVCASDATAARIDELQFTLGEGPCVQAFTTGVAVLVPDISDISERRWPVFAAAAAETGARGMYVFPLHVGAARVGVLDCYRDTAGSLDDAELSGALRAADAAVWTLLEQADACTMAHDEMVDDETTPDGPDTGRTAASSMRAGFDGTALARAEVHQATGMLTVQGEISARDALARLRSAAFTTDRPITEVAADVLAHRRLLDPHGAWHTNPPHPGHEELGPEEDPS